ncbi:MAG: M23 family metallopeptidase [Alphaproteobacteria bacterium]|nr:M23 family metallopeptidase [Alphaproteobacteria bacterium]
MSDPHALYPGQRVWIPGRPGSSSYTQYRPPSSSGYATPAPRPKPQSGDPSWPTRPSVGEGELSSRVAFDWPLRGRVITGFGVRANGERNDGINIAAAEGDPVRAAADGTVTYAGDELRGYGKLVLIRHPNGYVTAYAHNSSIRVDKGDRVRRGQVIAAAGRTGAVDRPQLHFEIRKGVQPVDPRRYLGGTYAAE